MDLSRQLERELSCRIKDLISQVAYRDRRVGKETTIEQNLSTTNPNDKKCHTLIL